MLLYDSQPMHPYIVRLFILERQNLSLQVQQIDCSPGTLENRRLKYRTEVNSRGEVPALRLDDNVTILTESLAICQYLDEIAQQNKPTSTSLFGEDAYSRAQTQMWLRRLDLEIVQPLNSWFRNGVESVDFYLGNRVPCPEARTFNKVQVNRGLNMLDDHFAGNEGKNSWICGERFGMPDIYAFCVLKMMSSIAGDWILAPGRVAFMAWMKRMEDRPASLKALAVFEGGCIDV